MNTTESYLPKLPGFELLYVIKLMTQYKITLEVCCYHGNRYSNYKIFYFKNTILCCSLQ